MAAHGFVSVERVPGQALLSVVEEMGPAWDGLS